MEFCFRLESRSIIARRLALLTFLAFAVNNLLAQQEQFKFKRLELKDGLSHPEVGAIFKDSRGFVWFGTSLGLNRFDGYSIKTFFHDPHDTTSIPGESVLQIFETPDGFLVIRTPAGIALYDPKTETFDRHVQPFYERYGTSSRLANIVRDTDGSYWFVEPEKLVRFVPGEKRSDVIQNIKADSSSIVGNDITHFIIDGSGNHWLVHANGIAEMISVQQGQWKVEQRIDALYNYNRKKQTSYKMLVDSDGDIWFHEEGINTGVFLYRKKEEKLEHLTTTSSPLRLNISSVAGVLEESQGNIWIGTDHGGINIVDKKKNQVRYILHRDGDAMSLASNSINRLYKDGQGIIWLGVYKRGINYYHPDIYHFDLYKHYSNAPGSLPFEDVNRFEEDKKGNLWIGTNGGGLLYFDREKGTFKQYLHDPGNKNSLSGNVIVTLCRDRDDNLWIGTYKEGLNKFDGKTFTRFSHNPGDSSSLPSQNVWEIFEDSKGRLWIGTLDGSAALLDKKTGKFHRLRTWGPNALQAWGIDAINEDRHGNIWFGTTNGIDVLSADGKTFTHYRSSSDQHSLSNNRVLDIMKDSKGRMWVATSDGVNLFDESSGTFRRFKEQRTRNVVLNVQEDKLGNIWMSTLNGLSRMTFRNGSLDTVSFRRYTESDGLQGRQFNLNAGFKTRNGELVFGGPTGFNITVGNKLADFVIDKIVFSELKLYENPVEIGAKIDGVVILDQAISEAKEIVLPPNKNFFSLGFSALNYFNPERDQYTYMLQGLNQEWLPVDAKNPRILFNSLNPGKYILRVRAINADGIPGKNEAVLAIVIQPPFWKTKTAFLVYCLFLAGLLFIARKVIQQREQLKFAVEQERREMQRLHELDMMKVKFFTNVSHEFRTPLTLILTPIERLIKNTKESEQLALFQLIQRNGKRLLNLVNQLLDFKKLEVAAIKLKLTKGDIILFVKETVMSFSDLAEKKNITFSFHSTVDRLNTLFDQDKLEKILFNLLSNAFKFTLEHGAVSVKVQPVMAAGEKFLEIDVSDTGIGIPQDKLEKIFEPFFQNDTPRSLVNQGSGIGLAITKEFVKIHGGRIEVRSEEGKGSSFTIRLPLHAVPEETAVQESTQKPGVDKDHHEVELEELVEGTIAGEGYIGKTKKKSLLLIDDNDDFRFYLKDNLKFLYTIYEAKNGKEGWRRILADQPDLIVSDIMMPEMSGVELCSKIKSDERVSHTPVILLTARSSEEQRIEGINAGAEDYITKPFSFEVLEARITNLLRQREKYQKQFRKTLDVKASELQITPLDVKFVENAVKVVEANVSSPGFSVEDLGVELGISRAYVFKKILALTGKTPLEFIRSIRLQHAAQLLERSQLSVQEVAYKVGFNSPKYFSKYFKEQYNMLPSEYAATKQQKE